MKTVKASHGKASIGQGSSGKAANGKTPNAKTSSAKTSGSKALSDGQRAYETKRAAKAGMSLEKWIGSKERQQALEAAARRKAADPPKPAKPPGFLARLLERANKPLRS